MAPGHGAPLRVASWNLRTAAALLSDRRDAWWFRREAALDTIEALDADLVALQEVRWLQRRWLDRRLGRHGWASVGVGRADGRRRGEQCTVLVRTARLDVCRTDARWFSSDPRRPGSRLPDASHPRVATLVELRDRSTGAGFHVADVHLDQRSEANRATSARLLLGWTEHRRPLVVLGDLNAAPGSAATDVLEAGGLRSALPADAPGTAHAWGATADPPRLDHIYVSDGWEVLDGHVDQRRHRGRLTSDHWPVVATLRLG